MENTENTRTQKKPGSGLIAGGLFLAAIALLMVVLVAAQGNVAGIAVWVALVLGIALACIGFGRRVLAALERN